MGESKNSQERPTPKAKQIGHARFRHFTELIPASGNVTKAIVTELARRCDLTERHVWRLVKYFLADRSVSALTPKKAGQKKVGRRISPGTREKIDKLIKQIYFRPTGVSANSAAREIISILTEENYEDIPSIHTIVRIIKDIPERKKAQARLGQSKKTSFEPHFGIVSSCGPLDVVQMDHTRGNVFLVCVEQRRPLARPWITFVVDVFTRCILGFYISLGAPSKFRCGRAVASALLPKEDWLKSIGLSQINYPMHGVFRRFSHDGAPAHKNPYFLDACRYAGIEEPDVRPLGGAHIGGHVERLIGTMVGEMAILPGATGRNVSNRDRYDPEKDAVFTLPELEKWLAVQISIYHTQPHAGLNGKSPLQVWEECALGKVLEYQGDRRDLRIRFLPTKLVTVQSNGIRFENCFYRSPVLNDHIRRRMIIHYDPYSTAQVYIDIGDQYVSIPRVLPEVPDCSLYDIREYFRFYREQGKIYWDSHGKTEQQKLRVIRRGIEASVTAATKSIRSSLRNRRNEGTAPVDLIDLNPTPKELPANPPRLLSRDEILQKLREE